MANVDNLNFKVILDDKDFNTRVEKDIELAKKLNVELSQLLQAKANIHKSGGGRSTTKEAIEEQRLAAAKAQTAAAQERLNTAKKNGLAAAERLATATANRTAAESRAANAVTKTAKAQRTLISATSGANNALGRQAGIISEMKSLAATYLSIRGISGFVSSLVRVTGEFELQKTTLAAMLGDLNKAEGVISRIQELAVESPFQFKELTTYAKQLSAFAVPAEELYETTKMLADVSAGLGVGMDRIVLAYGQVRSAAFLRGQEVRQFTEAGIPILDELAKQFTELEGRAVSTGEVFDKISARLVPFEMVAKVFKDMTSEGGKFYQMQEVQAETLRGKLSNLKDAYEVMLNEIGSQESGALKDAVDSIRSLMQNWQMVATAIKAVIATLVAYKASMALITGGQWVYTFAQTIGQWRKLNEILKFLNLNTIKFSEAMKAAGISTKALASAGVAALMALVVVIANAVKNASALRKELESIMTSEVSRSDKAVDDLNRLVENLKKATRGSQEYRDTISELNRKYGEYLPKILSEADAYDQVRVAADAAAEAIRNKAKASAFEKGSEAIEDDFGKRLTKRTTSLRDALTNMYDANGKQISKEIASEFIKNFNVALAQEGAMDDIEATIKKAFDNYFGEGKFEEYKLNFALATFEFDAKQYAKVRSEVIAAEKDLQSDLDARFGDAQFSSLKEREKIAEVEAWYRKEEDALKKLTLTQAEYNKKIQELDINKLRKLVTAYEEMGRSDVAAAYQKQIDALTKIPEGWRGKVQSVLTKMGLTKGSSFGLWAEDTTQSTTYVDEMVKRYKELAEQIKMVSPFDEEQTKRLKQNQQAIEAVSKALGINIKELAANKSETFESKEEKRIKRLIDALRKLQDQYEKLKAVGASDESIKTLFEGLYPELIAENGKDFVTDLKYIERAVGLVADLEKIAPEDAKKILVDLGADEFSTYLKKLQEQDKAYKDAGKAAKEYFNQLRKWKSEDFNLEGEGIAFDIDKISTNLSSKINEINLKTQKTKELFDQIGISDTSKRDEKAVKKVKEIFEKEFGKGSWDAFYEEFLSKGEAAFKTLADKEVAYEKKIAQEKINNLANSYVSDLTQGLDLSDWSDKSIGQIQFIREKLAALMSSDLPISDSLKSELTQLGLSTDSLIAKIKELLGGKYDMATLEKIKAVQDAAKEVSSYAKSSGEALSSLGDALNSDILKGAGKAVGYIGKMADAIMDSEAMMAKLALAFGDLDNMSEEAKKNLENVAESSDWITMVVKVILTAVTAIGNVIAKQRENLELAVDAAIAYREALADIARENSETIFGTSEISVLVTNLKAASEAAKEFHSELDKVMSADRGVGGWYLPSLGGEGGEGFNFTTIRDLQTLLKGKDFKSEKEMMEYLKANIEMWEGWSHLSDGIRTTSQLETEIKNLIKMYEAWDKANEQVKASLTDLFGQLGNDIATNMINSFIEVGKATDNLEESFQSLGQTILETFLQSAIIDDILMPKIDELSSMLKSVATGGMSLEEFGERLAATTNDLKAQIEAIAPGWEMIFQTWQKEGLLPTEGGGTSDLGEGIKGITEDTASLLASYINAMRADLSMMRGMQAKYLPIIGESMPTLLDYLARIQANTFDLAQSNAEILQETQKIAFELQSVMGFGDEGRAIRILS